MKFQFQNGSIKSPKLIINEVDCYRFQFQNGSIKRNPLLLILISVLLGFLVFYGKKQVESIENINSNFSKFQIESVKANSKLDKTIELYQQHENDLYRQELHPTTIRSLRKEKEINGVKADVNNLKSIQKGGNYAQHIKIVSATTATT